ncbi:MAG: hypothetical protein EP330_22680 [Deltaproteobacteria bacterium]|nr:MAG: hypothetical protein EP330_22680 [Deltaproteobacteria bacterium]
MLRALAIPLLLMPLTGCVIVFDDPSWDTANPDDPGNDVELPDGAIEPEAFTTFSFELEGDRASGWRFDRTQRHVGGVLETSEGLKTATLSLSTPTGGNSDGFALSEPWPGELVDSRRLWLDDQPLDWVAWQGEDAAWLGLRGITELTMLDELGATDVDAWVGDGEIVLAACGEAGLSVWTVSFTGTVLAEDHLDAAGDRCSVFASWGEPMVLHGDSAGGPLVRYRLTEGALTDALQLHDDTRADRVVTATNGDVGMLALFDGRQVSLMDTSAATHHIALERYAEPLVLDVLADGYAATAWADTEGLVHTHWGSFDDGFDSVTFDVPGPTAGLAVGLRDEVVSIAVFHGAGVILARQQRE